MKKNEQHSPLNQKALNRHLHVRLIELSINFDYAEDEENELLFWQI
jgi:hypothetical protein